MEDVVHLKVNVHLENAVVNMVIVVRPMNTVERVVNPNLVNVTTLLPQKKLLLLKRLLQPKKLLPKKLLIRRLLLQRRLPQLKSQQLKRLLLLNLLFQPLPMVDVVKPMVNVPLVNVVVSMVGVVNQILIVVLDVNQNLESVIKKKKKKRF